jgi:hypothetical protein
MARPFCISTSFVPCHSGRALKAMNVPIAILLMVLAVTSCTHQPKVSLHPPTAQGQIPPVAATVRGEHNFGEHVMIYGDYRERFLWGIIFPRDTLTSISSTEVPEPGTIVMLRSGINLAFISNSVTITRSMNKVRMDLKSGTVYLIDENLSAQNSEDVSGIRLEPKRVWSRWANDYVITHDLVLPQNLERRFGKQNF